MDPQAGPVSPSLIAEWVGRGFGIDVVGAEPVRLGADSRTDLLRVVAQDGQQYAAKTSSGHQPGLAVAALLADRGLPGVPSPVRTRSGGLTAAGGGVAPNPTSRLSLVPWVGADRVLDTGMAPSEWVRLGEVPGLVHATPTTAWELSAVPVEAHDPTAVVEQAKAFGLVVGQAARACPDDPVVLETAGLWEADGPRLLAVADRAVRLADSPSWADPTFVLCHGDPHHGNLLVDPGGQVWLVDWDDAVVAPREADLMFVVGGVFSHAPITEEQVDWFFDGYTPVAGVARDGLDTDLLTYLRCVRALVDVLDLLEDAMSVSEHTPSDRAEALGHARRSLGPGGLVTLALA